MDIFTTMITPFLENGAVDYENVKRYTEWYVSKGLTGIFAVCQSSEIFYLSLEERVAINKCVWETVQECSGATPICDAQKESCIGQNTNLVTMNDWFQANKTGYSNTKASPAFADGSLVTVTGAFYISDYISHHPNVPAP